MKWNLKEAARRATQEASNGMVGCLVAADLETGEIRFVPKDFENETMAPWAMESSEVQVGTIRRGTTSQRAEAYLREWEKEVLPLEIQGRNLLREGW